MGLKRPGLKLTTHLHLAPRLSKHGSIYALSYMPSWRSASLVKDKFNFFLFTPKHEGVIVTAVGMCWNRVSDMKLFVLAENFRGFSQSLQVNTGILPHLGRDRFFPNPLGFISHHFIRRDVVLVL
jgi:hypothetical protein